ncbi:MAG: exonuclease subunit SbcD [Candidatus Methanomethylicia archaeon]
MKFIHIADLHLGKKIKTIRGDLELDFCNPLNQIKKEIKDLNPDFLFISGDIFHYKNPSQDSEELFIDFLINSYNNVSYTFVISGNHDSSKKLFNIALFNKYINKLISKKVFIYTDEDLKNDILNGNLRPVSVENVDVIMIPFLEYRLALNAFYNQNIPKEYAYSFIHQSIISSFLENSKNFVKIVLAHTYIENAVLSGTESKNYLNSSYYVREGDLDSKVTYYALGHVHKYQRVGSGNVYYAGSIVPLDFGENFDHGIILGQIQNNFPKIEFCKLNYKEFVTLRQTPSLFEEIEKNKDKFVKVVYHNLHPNDIEKLLKFENVIKIQKEENKEEWIKESKSESFSSDPFDVIEMYINFYEKERKIKIEYSVLEKLRKIEESLRTEEF